MTTPGDRPRRGGFLSNISSALTPPIITDDDPDKPLVAPTGVKISSVLIAIAGLLFLFLGVSWLVNADSSLARQVDGYNQAVAKCVTDFGGIGEQATQAPAADAAKDVQDRFTACKGAKPLTQENIDAARSQNTIVCVVLIVIGLAAVGTSWFLRSGAAWARRLAVGLVILTMILTMFLQVSNLFTMIATLLLVAAVLMCYLGKGGVYFAKTAMRRRAA